MAEKEKAKELESGEESMSPEMFTDAYALTGAMNFGIALAIAQQHYAALNPQAQEEAYMCVVNRRGQVLWYGDSGDKENTYFPSRDQFPCDSGFIVMIEDFLADAEDDDEEIDEEEEAEKGE